MTSTYTTWDGKELPWPPPENWYRATDGRWWHPAHSPDDPPVASDIGDEEADSVGGNLPHWLIRQQTVDVEGDDFAAVLDAATGRSTITTDPSVAANGASPAVPDTADDEPDDQAGGRGGPSGDRRRTLMAVWGFVLGCLVLAAALTWFRIQLDDETDSIEPEDIVAEDIVAGDPDTPVPPAGQDDEVGVPPTTDGDAEHNRAVLDQPGAEVAGSIQVDDEIAVFRSRLEERGLDTDSLSSDQIYTFASTYCVYAAGATDGAQFTELREVALTTSESSLSDDQLNLIITVAVVSFCPDQAERLDITLPPS